jgi:hypothetical protein
MRLFADPSFPRRNLTFGALLLTVSALQFGSTVERIVWLHVTWVDYVFLVLWVALFFVALKAFRVGLASVPPDPGTLVLNERDPRGPGYWIVRVIFWIVLIVTPIVIIQFSARH